jgi:small-conductance mechanosensitive channel
MALRHATSIAVIGGIGWLISRLIHASEEVLTARHRIEQADNLQARAVVTQLRLLRRVAVVLVYFLTAAAIVMTFPSIRQIGTSLLASAGIAGIVVGLAARPTLSSLIAGIQLALTQPIRIDDVVIIDGEWGRIEEVTTTYVVVRIWDQRRLIVPLSRFIESPFQNWTRRTAELIGTVFVHVDYTVPVDEVRREVKRILEESGMWDGKVWNVQVTDATERTVQLRVLVSAPDSGVAWNLRCHVREKLIEYLRKHHPQSLPRTRAEVDGLREARLLEGAASPAGKGSTSRP